MGGGPGACLPLTPLTSPQGAGEEAGARLRKSGPQTQPRPLALEHQPLPTTQHILLSTLKPSSTGGTRPPTPAERPEVDAGKESKEAIFSSSASSLGRFHPVSCTVTSPSCECDYILSAESLWRITKSG